MPTYAIGEGRIDLSKEAEKKRLEQAQEDENKNAAARILRKRGKLDFERWGGKQKRKGRKHQQDELRREGRDATEGGAVSGTRAVDGRSKIGL